MKSEVIKLKAELDAPFFNLTTKSNEWINFDYDNLFTERVIEMSKSITNGAILKAKSNYMRGDGFLNEDLLDIEAELFFTMNDIDNILEKISIDYMTFGAFSLYIIWSKDKTKITYIKHIDVSKIRIGFPSDETFEIKNYFFSDDWAKYNEDGYIPKKLDAFDFETKEECPRQVFYHKKYVPGQNFYGIPDYWGAVDAIQSEIEILRSDLKLIQNSMRFSSMLTINGLEDPEAQEAYSKDLRRFLVGSDSAGKIFINYVDADSTPPNFTQMNTTIDIDAYSNKLESLQLNILQAHNFPGILANVNGKSYSIASAADEIINNYEILMSNVISPSQKDFENIINKILKINGSDFVYKIKNKLILNDKVSETLLSEILTIDELRIKSGYEKITK